jgi:LCP family protein required for cell wall assembly
MDIPTSYFRDNHDPTPSSGGQGMPKEPEERRSIWRRKSWLRFAAIAGAVLLVAGGAIFWKADTVLRQISSGEGGLLGNLVKSLPGIEQKLRGEEDGRINIALLGMRGEHIAGGGLLADTIMILSIHPKNETVARDRSKVSLVSIPRDVYVTMPGTKSQTKINAVHAYSEEKGRGQGMKGMEEILSEVTGVPIHYAVNISFQGFIDLVNAVGGIDVTLAQSFSEGLQFREPQVCDPYVFNVPTSPQQFQHKYYVRQNGTKYIAKSYPLCYNKDVECGGVFELPVGVNHLDGVKALCYARARYTSNDFERAKRQQAVLESLRAKAIGLGTLTDFGKINALFAALGDNVRTDMNGWEMKRFFDMYQHFADVSDPTKRVLEDSEEGLLYAPTASKETGYILLPRGDNYDRIHALFQSLP